MDINCFDEHKIPNTKNYSTQPLYFLIYLFVGVGFCAGDSQKNPPPPELYH